MEPEDQIMNTRREMAKKEGLWKDCGESYNDGVCDGEYEHPREEDIVDDGNGVIYHRNKDTGQLERIQTPNRTGEKE